MTLFQFETLFCSIFFWLLIQFPSFKSAFIKLEHTTKYIQRCPASRVYPVVNCPQYDRKSDLSQACRKRGSQIFIIFIFHLISYYVILYSFYFFIYFFMYTYFFLYIFFIYLSLVEINMTFEYD